MRLAFWKQPTTWTIGERVTLSPKLANRIKQEIHAFRVHLMIDRGFTDDSTYSAGNTLAAALRRLRTTRPSVSQMRDYLLWMRESGYSYSSQHNSILAFEAHARMRGLDIRFGRQPKPKRVLKDLLSKAEVSRIIQAAPTLRSRR